MRASPVTITRRRNVGFEDVVLGKKTTQQLRSSVWVRGAA
jgi:hypothetical protein